MARILLSLALVFTRPLSVLFFILFLACAISDALDGYVARKTGTVSKFGDNLDSIADFLMYAVLIGVLYQVLNLTMAMIVWVLGIAIVRILSMMVLLVKYKTFEMLHTYGNKMTGFILFVFILSLAFGQPHWLFYLICSIASLSAIEELLINLFSAELQLNKKSLFF